jgi:hypothetical protein
MALDWGSALGTLAVVAGWGPMDVQPPHCKRCDQFMRLVPQSPNYRQKPLVFLCMCCGSVRTIEPDLSRDE